MEQMCPKMNERETFFLPFFVFFFSFSLTNRVLEVIIHSSKVAIVRTRRALIL